MTTKTSMHIDPYERTWMIVSVVMLVVFLTAVSVAGFSMGIQLPNPDRRVDPKTVATDPDSPWHPDNAGLRELAPGKYEAYILASQLQGWRFIPNELTVPAGSTITFYVTSQDLQHGFKLENTNVNMMVLPGQVSKLTVTLESPGEYNFICHEYCGNGHAIMYGKVIVTP
ncbi:MAG: cytochrome c oxidase subunit II [Anaerolineales bacterium]